MPRDALPGRQADLRQFGQMSNLGEQLAGARVGDVYRRTLALHRFGDEIDHLAEEGVEIDLGAQEIGDPEQE